MPTSEEDYWLLDLGFQYYVAGRAAVLAGLRPVSGNLLHHALEMFLKARLSHRRTLEELKKPPFRHNLPKLWEAFKADFPNEALDEFDAAITALSHFEHIRYPEAIIKKGGIISIGWGPRTLRLETRDSTAPCYEASVPEIDNLVAKIFSLCSRNPSFFVAMVSEYGLDAIKHHNPVADKLVSI